MRYKPEIESEMIGKYLDEIDKMRADNVALRADNTRLESACAQMRFMLNDQSSQIAKHDEQVARLEAQIEELVKNGSEQAAMLDKRDEVVKACEVALNLPRFTKQRYEALALIHTLQSGEKKEGSQ